MKNIFFSKKRFTLTELLIVIVILGILIAIIIPQITSFNDDAKQTRLMADIRNTQTAVDMYHTNSNQYPTSDGQKPLFTNEPIVWEKLVSDYLRKKPKLEKDQTLYIDPYGTVTLNYNSHAYFLRWLKNSDFIVTDPSKPVYKGTNPPIGSVMHNYNMNTQTFENFKGKKYIYTLTTAYTGDALLEAYTATKDKVFLDRAKLIGDYLQNITFNDTVYSIPVTKIYPRLEYDGTSWKPSQGEVYSKDMAIAAHFLIELSIHTQDQQYANTGKKLLDSLITAQNVIENADNTDYKQIKGALPYIYTNGGISWSHFPTDIAVMVYDASVSGYNYFKDDKYLKLKDDYFAFLEKSFTQYNGVSPQGYPYEFISYDSVNKTFFGQNHDQTVGTYGEWGKDKPFTTDQCFYLVLGLIKQNSPSADAMYSKIASLHNGFLFWGQYYPDGTPASTAKETFNTALYLEMSKYKNPQVAKELEKAMLEVMIKDEKNPLLDASFAWAPKEYIVEDLVSAYVPKSILYQRSFDNVKY